MTPQVVPKLSIQGCYGFYIGPELRVWEQPDVSPCTDRVTLLHFRREGGLEEGEGRIGLHVTKTYAYGLSRVWKPQVQKMSTLATSLMLKSSSGLSKSLIFSQILSAASFASPIKILFHRWVFALQHAAMFLGCAFNLDPLGEKLRTGHGANNLRDRVFIDNI